MDHERGKPLPTGKEHNYIINDGFFGYHGVCCLRDHTYRNMWIPSRFSPFNISLGYLVPAEQNNSSMILFVFYERKPFIRTLIGHLKEKLRITDDQKLFSFSRLLPHQISSV